MLSVSCKLFVLEIFSIEQAVVWGYKPCMSVVSETSCSQSSIVVTRYRWSYMLTNWMQPFLWSGQLLWLHIHWSYELNLCHLWVSIIHGPYLLLCVICTTWAACPWLSWSAVAMHVLTFVTLLQASFTPMLCYGSSPSPTEGWACDYMRTFSLREIFKMHSFKIYSIWPQASKHTHTHAQSEEVEIQLNFY